MASLGTTFRPEDAPPGDGFDPIPAGDYLAQIVDSEVGPTKNGDGTILKLVWEVLSGPCERRQVYDRLNIVNANATAQGIAQRALAAICTACGKASVSDSEELHFIPCTIRVEIRKDKTGNYGPQNTIKKYLQANAAAPAPSRAAAAQPAPARAAPQAAAAPARPLGGGSRPWNNRAPG